MDIDNNNNAETKSSEDTVNEVNLPRVLEDGEDNGDQEQIVEVKENEVQDVIQGNSNIEMNTDIMKVDE
jgi:uncharacterized protein YheU (UPF0270 family)